MCERAIRFIKPYQTVVVDLRSLVQWRRLLLVTGLFSDDEASAETLRLPWKGHRYLCPSAKRLHFNPTLSIYLCKKYHHSCLRVNPVDNNHCIIKFEILLKTVFVDRHWYFAHYFFTFFNRKFMQNTKSNWISMTTSLSWQHIVFRDILF